MVCYDSEEWSGMIWRNGWYVIEVWRNGMVLYGECSGMIWRIVWYDIEEWCGMVWRNGVV